MRLTGNLDRHIISEVFEFQPGQTIPFLSYLPFSAKKKKAHIWPGQEHSPLCYSPALKKWGLYWICLVLPSFCHSVILSFHNISNENFRHTFLRNCEAQNIETLYTRGQWTDVSCIPESGCSCLFVPLFLHFSFSPIFKHWNFSSHFSQKLWGLEDWNLVHTWTVGRCIVYTEIRLLLCIRLFIHFSFQFSNIKIFRHTFLRNCEA